MTLSGQIPHIAPEPYGSGNQTVIPFDKTRGCLVDRAKDPVGL